MIEKNNGTYWFHSKYSSKNDLGYSKVFNILIIHRIPYFLTKNKRIFEIM